MVDAQNKVACGRQPAAGGNNIIRLRDATWRRAALCQQCFDIVAAARCRFVLCIHHYTILNKLHLTVFNSFLISNNVIELLLFTNSGTCLFDIVHSALWGSEYPVCTPDTQVLFLSGAHMLHTQQSAVQVHPGRL
jgi:hypothetical protein